jgi:transposase
MLGDKTSSVGARGFDQVLRWARAVGVERVWALGDCRRVSGSLERFLIARGERVVGVPTRLMANSRRASRERGSPIASTRSPSREPRWLKGIQTSPTAELAGPRLDVRLLVDHRERLVRTRRALNNTPGWHLHDLWPELEPPGSSPFYGKRSTRIARRLARAEQTIRVRIARDEPRRLRELTQAINALESEIAELAGHVAPQLLTEPGSGPRPPPSSSVRSPAPNGSPPTRSPRDRPGSRRFRSVQARPTGIVSIARGNRQINAATHRVAVTRARCHQTIEFVARTKAEGKTHRTAIPRHKRHLARRITQLPRAPHPASETTPQPSTP